MQNASTMVNVPLPPYEEKVAELLQFIELIRKAIPGLSIRKIEQEAGVFGLFISRLEAGGGANYENIQKLDAWVCTKRQQLAALGAAISTNPAAASSAAVQ